MKVEQTTRQPVFKFNPLPKWDASCEATLADSTVICGVLGPTESKSSTASSSGMTIDITIRPPVGQMTNTERHIESILTDLFPIVVDASRFPYTQVVACFEVASYGGSALSVIVNSFLVSLQLLGLPLKMHAFAVTCAVSGNDHLLFPSFKEEQESQTVSTLVVDCESHKVVYATCTATGCDVDQLIAMANNCGHLVDSIKGAMYTQTVATSSH